MKPFGALLAVMVVTAVAMVAAPGGTGEVLGLPVTNVADDCPAWISVGYRIGTEEHAAMSSPENGQSELSEARQRIDSVKNDEQGGADDADTWLMVMVALIPVCVTVVSELAHAFLVRARRANWLAWVHWRRQVHAKRSHSR